MTAEAFWSLSSREVKKAIFARALPGYAQDGDRFMESQLASPFASLHKEVKIAIYESSEWRGEQ